MQPLDYSEDHAGAVTDQVVRSTLSREAGGVNGGRWRVRACNVRVVGAASFVFRNTTTTADASKVYYANSDGVIEIPRFGPDTVGATSSYPGRGQGFGYSTTGGGDCTVTMGTELCR